ncbi:endonuclease domain-containing protein [Streptomyces misionensis]|uniref:endonuclease domain-containing protein n=1 Tax=Streptomyces misionensis TaxID=67331 RepID=UPI0033E286AA
MPAARRRPPIAVDHDAVRGQVRGAVCRSCNSWLGPMEAALRGSPRVRQQQAAYLHWRIGAGGTAAPVQYARELSYRGTTVKEFADGLLAVCRLLAVPCVYWTGRAAGPAREIRWTKTGPLVDAKGAERHHRRLQSRRRRHRVRAGRRSESPSPAAWSSPSPAAPSAITNSACGPGPQRPARQHPAGAERPGGG